MRAPRRPLGPILSLVAAVVCGACASSAASGHPDTAQPLHVTILGEPDDQRVPSAREALFHWNDEFRRLALPVQFDSGTVVRDSVADERTLRSRWR